MEKVKLAIFGLNQGYRLGKRFIEYPTCDLVAVAGFGKQAEDAAAELNAKLYGDYHELLEKEDVDAAVVALPNQMHLESVRACVEAGIKYILIEKPIADTPEAAKEMVALCEANDVTLLVGHHRRSANLFLFLKEFLASGKLGDIVNVSVSYALNKQLNYWDDEWHKEQGGGPLLNNAIHDMDDLNNVLDMHPVKVYAAKRNTIRGYNAEDSATAIIEFAEGPTATYFVSDGVPSPWAYDLLAKADERFAQNDGYNSMHIYGTKGSFGFPNMDFFTYEDIEHWGWEHPLVHEHYDVELNDPLESETEHFLNLCLGIETVPRCSAEQGMRSLQIVTAIVESANTGEIVHIK